MLSSFHESEKNDKDLNSEENFSLSKILGKINVFIIPHDKIGFPNFRKFDHESIILNYHKTIVSKTYNLYFVTISNLNRS